HLVVLARRLPPGTARLRRGGCVPLTPAGLAPRSGGTLAVCRAGVGVGGGPPAGGAPGRARGGGAPPAAPARAGGQRPRAGGGGGGDRGGGARGVGAILAEALDTLSAGERLLLAQVGRLPLLDAPLADAATGIEGYFARALAAGIPFTPGQSQWWDLPGPVR